VSLAAIPEWLAPSACRDGFERGGRQCRPLIQYQHIHFWLDGSVWVIREKVWLSCFARAGFADDVRSYSKAGQNCGGRAVAAVPTEQCKLIAERCPIEWLMPDSCPWANMAWENQLLNRLVLTSGAPRGGKILASLSCSSAVSQALEATAGGFFGILGRQDRYKA
jgi:hypothetical protein